MLHKVSTKDLARAIDVAEREIVAVLLERLSAQPEPMSSQALRQKTGHNTVLFEIALQNLISSRLVKKDKSRGLILTSKGLLFTFENRERP